MKKLISSPEPYGETGKRDTELEFYDEVLQGKVYLMRFESRKMESFLEMVKSSTVVDANTVVCCTGGGSRKYAGRILEQLGIAIHKADELGCLVEGINFSLQHGIKELYRVNHETFRSSPLPYFAFYIWYSTHPAGLMGLGSFSTNLSPTSRIFL